MAQRLIQLVVLAILPFLISPPVFAQVLQTSDQWEGSSNVLVQKEIDVEQQSQSSPVDQAEIALKFKSGVSATTQRNVIRAAGTAIVKQNSSTGMYKVKVASGEALTIVINKLKENSNVLFVEPVYYYRSRWIPNDEKYPHQWNLDNPLMDGIHMQQAWEVTRGDPSTVIAVVDTGVAYERYYDQENYYYLAPDLVKTNFVPGYDFVNDDNHPNDDNWHGTLITGIIAQTTNNGAGTAGICPDCSIMPVKVLDSNGYGNTFNIAEGIIWAADQGAQVINLSFGGPEPSAVVKEACSYAYSQGSTLICASGNRGMDRLIFPASYNDYCIAVGGTRFDETRAYYSDYGPSLDLVAPGGDTRIDQNADRLGDGILAMTFKPGGYNDWVYLFAVGTSMATAHVSGVAGLMISAGVASTPAQVRQVLQETAEDRGPIGFDIEHGWGMVDAYAAVTYQGFSAAGLTEESGQESGQTGGTETQVSGATGGSGAGVETTGTEGDGELEQSTQGLGGGLQGTGGGGQDNIFRRRGAVIRFKNRFVRYLGGRGLPSYLADCGYAFDGRDVPVSLAYQYTPNVVIARVTKKSNIRIKELPEHGGHLFRQGYTAEILQSFKGLSANTTIKLEYNRVCQLDPADERLSCQFSYHCRPHISKGETYLMYLGPQRNNKFEINMSTRIDHVGQVQEEIATLEELTSP